MMKKIRPLFTLMTVLFVSVFLSFILKEDSSSGNLTNEIKRCATTEYMEMKLQNDNVYRKNLEEIQKYIDEYLKKNKIKDNLLITIPTVVHVVYNVNNPLQNISYQQVLSQIRVMNEDFRRLNRDTINTPAPFKPVAADIQVEFCLAKRDPNNNPSIGVTRTATTVTEFGLNDAVKFNASGGHDAWDRDKYLNIWVCNLQSTLLGYAQFPGGPAATDGVVIDYQGFGTIGTATFPYNLGRTTIHEVGHWLYLFHIWGDDNGACWGTDQVDDTPNQASEFYGCPIYPTVDACTPSSPGVMFMNYMDYTDDRCMNIFTQGQSVRMNAVMNGFRAPLQTSNGCTPVSGVPIAMFTADSVSIQYANPVHFFDISGGIPTSWNWSFPGGTPQSSSVQNPTIIYNTPGLYSVSLRVSNASGSDSITFVNYIRVRGAVLNSFGLVSPPSFSRIYVSSNDPTIENFTWQKSSTNPTVFYKFKIRKIASTEYSYLSNNSGSDSVISLRRGFLDSLAAAMGTTGDSVRCSWRVFAFNGIDSLASSTTFLVTLVRSPIGIQKISSEVPDKFALYNNYPNPFNPSTTIRFDIPAGLKNEFIKLTIYDITGRQVEMLLNEKLEPGKYSADWNSINYSSGIYFYRILAGQYTDTKKMILVK